MTKTFNTVNHPDNMAFDELPELKLLQVFGCPPVPIMAGAIAARMHRGQQLINKGRGQLMVLGMLCFRVKFDMKKLINMCV